MNSTLNQKIAFLLILFIFQGSSLIFSQTNTWTHFRGSDLNGVSSETKVPLKWNDSVNISWKTKIHGKGWSSPVVYGNQVWVTTATEDGKEMFGVGLDLNTGKIVYDISLFKPDTVHSKHSINTYATPTPCIEENYVYLNFGSYGTACVRTSDGSVIWKRIDLKCEHVQGPGSSPILYKNLLILHFEGTDVQYIIALNKRTGETVWKKERPSECYKKLEPIGKKAYITPIIMNVNGKDLLISNGSAVCIAYDVVTGEEVWRIIQGEDSTISMPFSEAGILYFYTGFVTPTEGEKYAELLAVNPIGSGNIKETNILWRLQSPILQLLTPVIKDGIIYTVDTRNTLLCIDAKTGKYLWTKKLKSKYNSSPIIAGDKIFLTSITGETLVLKHKTQEILQTNKLKGEVYATPAILQNSIILRTSDYLYRISQN